LSEWHPSYSVLNHPEYRRSDSLRLGKEGGSPASPSSPPTSTSPYLADFNSTIQNDLDLPFPNIDSRHPCVQHALSQTILLNLCLPFPTPTANLVVSSTVRPVDPDPLHHRSLRVDGMWSGRRRDLEGSEERDDEKKLVSRITLGLGPISHTGF